MSKLPKIFLTLLFPVFSFGQIDADHLRNEIQKIIYYDTEMKQEEIPHLMVGILMRGERYYFDFGVKAEAEPIGSSHLFAIGDLTKVFTALLFLSLEEAGEIDLEQNWNHFLPAEFQHENFDSISLTKTLTHHSGLPKLPTGIGSKERDDSGSFTHYSYADLLENIRDFRPNDFSKFEYSQTGYALLEYFLDRSMKESYDVLLKEKVLQPLGLYSTYIDNEATPEEKTLEGYDLGGLKIKRASYLTFGASLGLVSSAEDLLQLAERSWTVPPAWYEKSLTEFRPINDYQFLDIGNGWHRMTDKKVDPIYLHTGKTEGFRSYFAMLPETKTAVVVLSNSKLPHGGLGYRILKMINFNWNKRKAAKNNG